MPQRRYLMEVKRALATLFLLFCVTSRSTALDCENSLESKTSISSEQQALETARTHAEQSGLDLRNYDVSVKRAEDLYHVAFRIKNRRVAGGLVIFYVDIKTGIVTHSEWFQ